MLPVVGTIEEATTITLVPSPVRIVFLDFFSLPKAGENFKIDFNLRL